MPNDIVVFDKPYSADKIAEGRAVQWAVISGACDNCMYLKECASDKNFKFPLNAPLNESSCSVISTCRLLFASLSIWIISEAYIFTSQSICFAFACVRAKSKLLKFYNTIIEKE